jgi:hypothetical protein
MLCDATEGRFRIGNVRFVRSAGGRLGADIFAFDYADTSHSLPPNISANGTHVDLYRPDPMTVAHELGHYVFGLGDQYGTSFPPGPCRHGDGFDSAPDSVNTSMMEFSNYSPYCCTRTNSGEDWSVHSMQSCDGVEDCFQLAEDLGFRLYGDADRKTRFAAIIYWARNFRPLRTTISSTGWARDSIAVRPMVPGGFRAGAPRTRSN